MWIKIAEKRYLNMDKFVEVKEYNYSRIDKCLELRIDSEQVLAFPINSPEAQAILRWLEGTTNDR